MYFRGNILIKLFQNVSTHGKRPQATQSGSKSHRTILSLGNSCEHDEDFRESRSEGKISCKYYGSGGKSAVGWIAFTVVLAWLSGGKIKN
jgi:hypothetical protein